MYSDACHRGDPDTTATTVDEFVDAMAADAQEHRGAFLREDITVDGYAGKRILVLMGETVYWGSECTGGTLALFGMPGDDPAGYSQGQDQIDDLWALDVDGLTVVLVGAYYPDTPQRAMDELRAILESATFE